MGVGMALAASIAALTPAAFMASGIGAETMAFNPDLSPKDDIGTDACACIACRRTLVASVAGGTAAIVVGFGISIIDSPDL